MATDDTAPQNGDAAARPSWPRWKLAAFLVAAAMVLTGGGLRAYAELKPSPAGERAAQTASAERSLGSAATAAGGTRLAPSSSREDAAVTAAAATAEPAPPTTVDLASPVLIESGLSFFLAFCIGAALRAMAKLAIVMIGLGMLGTLGLQHAGVVPPIDWSALEGTFRGAILTVQGWLGHVERAVHYSLPSGVMGGIGLAAGLRRGR